MESIFTELTLILLVALIVSGIMVLLKQPLIIGYIISGILVSPHFLNIVKSTDAMSIFAELGIAILLFMVGLNLNPKIIKDVGKISLITGLGQIIFTSIIGFVIALFFGFSYVVSGYIAVAITFSSTIIIMKLLSDKGDLETLYGRIAVGFLIIQDIVAMLILMVVSSASKDVSFVSLVVESLLKGLGLSAIILTVSYFFLPGITKVIAKSQEYLLLFSIGWCLILASLFHYLNFSIEIGALLAGITLAISPYRFEISAKMKPLRDFFVLLFFILLGSQMTFGNIGEYVAPIIVFSVFILIGNPLIMMIIMGLLGYTKKNSFLAGLTVAQISEFSLILVALGVKMEHLPREILSVVTVIGLITIAGSTYFILYSNKIYKKMSRFLKIFERKGRKVDEHRYCGVKKYDILLFGYDRVGFDLLEAFKKMDNSVLVVDYNPEIIADLAREGIDCIYGDASDVEMLDELEFCDSKMIVSTVPDTETNLLVISKIRERNEDCIIIVVSHQFDESIRLYDEGATYVIMPQFLGGRHTSVLIEEYGLNLDKFLKEKASHIKHINRHNMTKAHNAKKDQKTLIH